MTLTRLFALASIALIATLAVSCATATATRVNPGHAKPENCKLDLFTSESEVKRPYQVACLIDATSGRTLFADRTINGALEQARPEACSCGADAMLLMSATTKGWSANEGYGEGTAVVRAIRYTGPAEPPPAAAAAPLPGQERGACLADQRCTGSLVCASGMCVAVPPPAAPPPATRP